MQSAPESAFQTALIGLLFILPGSVWADTVYNYSGGGDSFSITLDLSISGASILNLPTGTDVSGDLVSLVFSAPGYPPPADEADFALGEVLYTPGTIEIGTNGLGQITSWTITDLLFASYPAFPGENPNDFFCTYNLSSKSSTDSVGFGTDNDAGFCPGTGGLSSASNPSGWGAEATSTTPEPQSYILLSGGLVGILSLAALRRRRVNLI